MLRRYFPKSKTQTPVLASLSQAIQNAPAKPLHASLKQLLPSLNAQHIVNLINSNPFSLSPPSLFTLFRWLSTPGNSNFRHTLHSYCTMIHFLCSHQMFSEAKSLLNILVQEKGETLLPMLLQQFLNSKDGRVVDAEKMLREMLRADFKADVGTYTMIMDGFCKNAEVRKASMLLKEMQRDGIVVSVITYNVLINGYCKVGQMKNADMLLTAMINLGVEPDDITFNILLEGYRKYRKGEDARRLRSAKGLVLDYASYKSLIDSLNSKSRSRSKE